MIRADLVTGPADNEEILEQSEFTYRVDRFGVTSDFNAGLIFVKRAGNGATGDRSVNFDPAPSLSWILRYRARDAAAWNTLGLGAGLGVTAVQFNDGAPQVGLGPELSVFSGVLYGGVGWNLQVETDRRYYYLGIGVLESARQVSHAL